VIDAQFAALDRLAVALHWTPALEKHIRQIGDYVGDADERPSRPEASVSGSALCGSPIALRPKRPPRDEHRLRRSPHQRQRLAQPAAETGDFATRTAATLATRSRKRCPWHTS